MWVVGSVIFAAYMYATIWNITRNKVEEETTDDERYDTMDMDGMGNFSRFPAQRKTTKRRKRWKNTIDTLN